MTDDKKDELLAEENNLVSVRRRKLSEIRAKREAYPNDFKKGVSAAWIHSEFEKMEKPAFIFDGRNHLNHKELYDIGFNVYSDGKTALTHF